MTTRDMILDVMNDIDADIVASHISRKNVTGFRKFLRYAAPAAVYVAACIVALLVIPQLIGKEPVNPDNNGPAAIVTTEDGTTATEDITEIEETKGVIETEAVTAESEEADTETDTDPPKSEAVSKETTPVETTPAQTTAPKQPAATAATTTAKPSPKPEKEPASVAKPKGFTDVSGSIPFSYLFYSDRYINEKADKLLEENKMFSDAKAFKNFLTKYKEAAADDLNPPLGKYFSKDAEYFNEAFFKTHNLYFFYTMLSSGSINIEISDITIENGQMCVHYNVYEPNVQTCDLKCVLFVFAVEKSVAKNVTSISRKGTAYVQVFDQYVGKTMYYLSENVEDMTTILTTTTRQIPNFDGKVNMILTADDLSRVKSEFSKACNNNIGGYFPDDPFAGITEASLSEYGYVMLGIYNSEYVNSDNPIRITLGSDDVLYVSLHTKGSTRVPMEDPLVYYTLKIPKRILSKAKSVQVNELLQASTTSKTENLKCEKCGQFSLRSEVWASSVHPEYGQQTGTIWFIVGGATTQDIFKVSPDTTDEVIRRYLQGIEFEDLHTSDYSNNPDLVADIISGRHPYKLVVGFTLKDKSVENITAVLNRFGCKKCSSFTHCYTSYS